MTAFMCDLKQSVCLVRAFRLSPVLGLCYYCRVMQAARTHRYFYFYFYWREAVAVHGCSG